jgi:hypothetical protein
MKLNDNRRGIPITELSQLFGFMVIFEGFRAKTEAVDEIIIISVHENKKWSIFKII